MNIYYLQKHIELTDGERNYIEEKLSHLKKFRRMEDEATLVQVSVELFDSKISNQDISMAVNISLPNATVRAEVNAKTVEEGIDLAYEKLKVQLEKYKERA